MVKGHNERPRALIIKQPTILCNLVLLLSVYMHNIAG